MNLPLANLNRLLLVVFISLTIACGKDSLSDPDGQCAEKEALANCAAQIATAAQWEYEKCKATHTCPKEKEEQLCLFSAYVDSYHLQVLTDWVHCLPDGRPDKEAWLQTLQIKLDLHWEIPCAADAPVLMGPPDFNDFPDEIRENIKRSRESGGYNYPCLPPG